jgi:hypothetical protein
MSKVQYTARRKGAGRPAASWEFETFSDLQEFLAGEDPKNFVLRERGMWGKFEIFYL